MGNSAQNRSILVTNAAPALSKTGILDVTSIRQLHRLDDRSAQVASEYEGNLTLTKRIAIRLRVLGAKLLFDNSG
jgi:hypothetical protein